MKGKEYKPVNGWLEMEDVEREEIFSFNKDYAEFLDDYRTEREFVKGAIGLLEAEGFKNLEEFTELKKGDKFYKVNRDKAILAAIVGEKSLEEGLRIVGSHIDSPRIDLKPTPLYEDSELAYFSTHYYGGIKKYQWVSIPLALHGVVIKEDGTKVEINIGDKEGDPVFYISDLLPHLGKDQMAKKMSEGITGEQLRLIIGSIPARKKDGEEKDSGKKVKSAVLDYLFEEYGIVRRPDQLRITIVPALKSRDVF